MTEIVKTIFPEGNRWFYYVVLPWVFGIAVFLISLPALLVATGYRYEDVTGVPVDFCGDLINLSSWLYDVAFWSWRGFIIFVAISCFFDMYYLGQRKRREAGYL